MSSRQFCSSCKEYVEAEVDEAEGHAFCALCGLQLENLLFESGPQFVKTGDTARLAGSLVRDDMLAKAGGGLSGYGDDSRERSVTKGQDCIRNFAYQLQIPDTQMYIDQATRVYQLAISTGFTRGRRTNQVAAACLYVVLRQDKRPYMLIDFCHLLSVNVYVLGATYLRLTERLRLDTHPVLVTTVDPSLYIHRFAGRLNIPEKRLDAVVHTTMALIAQMKRDWMQTGRRPAGVCGAALWLSCHIHSFPVSTAEIIKVVSVGESTIMHRINELRGTSSSDLTLQEFKTQAKRCLEHQHAMESIVLASEGSDRASVSGTACQHVLNKGAAEIAWGMCQECYTDYVRTSGGIVEGAEDPPAFSRNLRREVREMAAAAQRAALVSVMAAAPGAVPQASRLLPPAGSVSGAQKRSANGSEGASLGSKGRGRKRRPRSARGADPVELEFALALLQNDRVRWMADALRIEGVDLAVADADEARALLAEVAERDAEGDPAVAAESAPACDGAAAAGQQGGASDSGSQRRTEPPSRGVGAATLRVDEGDPSDPSPFWPTPLSSDGGDLAAVLTRGGGGLDAAAMLAMSRAHELQDGTAYDLTRVSEEIVVSDDMRQRARALAAQSAQMPPEVYGGRGVGTSATAAPQDGTAVEGLADTRAGEPDGAVPNVQPPDAPAEQVHSAQAGSQGGAVVSISVEEDAGVGPDGMSDIDDDEIESYIATEAEADLRREIWTMHNQDWVEKQRARNIAKEAAGPDDSNPRRRSSKRGRPFKPGDTAEESVLNMLQAKNIKSRVNEAILHQFFRDAERIGKVAAGPDAVRDAQEAEAAAAAAPVDGDDFLLRESQVGQQIKEVQKQREQSKSARTSKHLKALERERLQNSSQMDLFPVAPEALRLGRLTRGR